ncbi:universal stress protein [Natronorubrum thiooxidans]|uniref:Nucleotide-binding universal stress protein, UspA family n=1 Tax=Natronorubrum thiooxidans TaxID=308853 RepID=A0A1N7GH30_9EURY|nr:universal stress protein [Natronorubrum thiooxidans]SIS11897.1 Nucleotide-binding universal stress protein, UspA family [Natronorubrum thiooxidans]
MYDTILIPTDGSDVAENAIDHAIDLAKRYDATLHTLYVVDTDAIDISLGTEQVQRIKDGKFGEMSELKDRATAATSTVADRARADLEVVQSVKAGQPHRVISAYATDNDVDLIVMGSAGRGGVRRAILGSVAERTLRTTRVPVLVVDMHENDD